MPLTREQTKYVPSNDIVFLPTVAIDSNLGVRGNSVFDGTATFNNGLIVNQSGSIFGGTINENSIIPGLHAGIQNGTPRLMFAPPGSLSSANNWQIDVNSGVFRWFTPGIVQMSLSPTTSGGIVSTNQLLTSGSVAFGTSISSTFRLDVAGAPARFKSGLEWSAYVQNSSATSSNRNHIIFQRDNAGTATTNGFTLGGIGMAGFDGTNYGLGWNGGVELNAFAAETWTPTARGTSFSIFNTTIGTNTPTERLKINGDEFPKMIFLEKTLVKWNDKSDDMCLFSIESDNEEEQYSRFHIFFSSSEKEIFFFNVFLILFF